MAAISGISESNLIIELHSVVVETTKVLIVYHVRSSDFMTKITIPASKLRAEYENEPTKNVEYIADIL